jgi:aspartyl-tRNA(Asn)/glutamyl-tRNA(Gln) amidotransferase subunit A
MNPEDLSLTASATAIRSGSLSPVDYAQALLSRIEAAEPKIQAWVTLDRQAVLAEARKLEDEVRNKNFRGPLHGVPIGIKDIFYTKGLKTTMGSVVFKDFIPDEDATAVKKLKQAGAVILGKTVTTQFANLDPGPTRNPWNLEHTPGGSSSGSATAVAARMCPAALGTQTLGSVGRPAAFCGVASLVPASQRIGMKNVFPLAWSLDHAGVFARSVLDLRLMLDVLAESPIGPGVRPLASRNPVRIGFIRGFFFENATLETRMSNDALANRLATAGFEVEEARLPAIFDIQQAILRTLLRSETSSIHERLFAEHSATYSPKLRTLIETGMLVDAADYLHAKRLRRKYQREMAGLFEKFDVLMTPAARGPAPEGIGATGDPVMNGPWTLSDFPTMTLPFALAANGLPLGIQLTGPPLQENLLLEIGAQIETVIGWKEEANYYPSNR